MSVTELKLEKEIETTLMQINDVLNKNIQLLRDLKQLTNQNSNINVLIGVAHSQFDLLKSKYNLPDLVEVQEASNTASPSIQIIEQSREQ